MNNTENNKDIVKANTTPATTDTAMIIDGVNVEQLADNIANSPLFNEAFIVDAGDGRKTVSRASIVTTLIIGNKLGFSVAESIILNRRINNPQTLIKVEYGRNLGIPPMASINNIYIWPSGGKEVVYTGIHIINAALSKAKVKREIIEDGTKIVATYTRYKSNQPIDFDPKQHVVVNNGASDTVIEMELKEGKLPVVVGYTKRATVKLTRGDESITTSYTLQEATDAGLYRGTTTYGEEVKGKDNWNNHPAVHLRKMAIMNGARIIASDVLFGIYIPDELHFVKDTSSSSDIEDVEYVD